MTLTAPAAGVARPPLPSPRGPVSKFLLDRLRLPVHLLPAAPEPADDPIDGDDTQLSLYLCYELHYRGLAGVDEAWEWEPSLLQVRRTLESGFEDSLVDLDAAAPAVREAPQVVDALRAAVETASGPSLSRFLSETGSWQQLREFAVHRSAYQLKEADPHSWGFPRLDGLAKAALVEIQTDEYGGGRPGEAHAELFAATMESLGLDSRYGIYLDRLPGPTLATSNLISLFGLHRRWRGALVGHLAAFEMTSVTPMSRYSRALSRHGVAASGRRFYDVHVQADARHEMIAADDLVAGFVRAEPALAGDVLFGARSLMSLEARFSRHLLDSWSAGATSLRYAL